MSEDSSIILTCDCCEKHESFETYNEAGLAGWDLSLCFCPACSAGVNEGI